MKTDRSYIIVKNIDAAKWLYLSDNDWTLNREEASRFQSLEECKSVIPFLDAKDTAEALVYVPDIWK